jgi:hypothetical protein
MEDKTHILCYKQDEKTIKFDFYGLGTELIPSLIRQLSTELHMRTIAVSHAKERAEFAQNLGMDTTDLLRQQLKLKF